MVTMMPDRMGDTIHDRTTGTKPGQKDTFWVQTMRKPTDMVLC